MYMEGILLFQSYTDIFMDFMDDQLILVNRPCTSRSVTMRPAACTATSDNATISTATSDNVTSSTANSDNMTLALMQKLHGNATGD